MPYTHPPRLITLPVQGRAEHFPVSRVFCVGRNYAQHALEMGFTGREPPFFFMKPADSLLVVEEGQTGQMHYPPLSTDLHHEIELVACIGTGGTNIGVPQAMEHVWGYAVGLDMTRRDLQNAQKKLGRPWEIGKGFDEAAPISHVMPAAQVGDIAKAAITLSVNGQLRQSSTLDQLIWSVAEIVAHLSTAWSLRPGDLIYTGTPAGVGAVARGDVMLGAVTGVGQLRVEVV